MVILLTQFADNSTGLGALGLNLSSFIIQLLTFVIALLILKRWAFKPILRIMNERKKTIAKGVELGEQMQKDKEKLDETIEKQLSEARDKADSILASANEAAKDTVRKAEVDAETKAKVIIDEAKAQTKQDMALAKKKLESEIIDLVADATEVITGDKIDRKKDAELIDRALTQGVEQ
jgi:F-type H+-transporting ATPase subunit b